MTKAELIEELNKTQFEVREDYSGRFMYSKSCPAVKLDGVSELYDLGRELAKVDIEAPTLDNLGRGYVAYWPSITK